MMNVLADLWTIVCVGAGVVFFLAGTVGLLRFPDSLTRLHALTKADNLGLGLVVIGLLPQADGVVTGLKMIFIWLLVMVAGACVAQLIARRLREAGDDA
jgi:multicomponent Na+:H+ antiporter subunit G